MASTRVGRSQCRPQGNVIRGGLRAGVVIAAVVVGPVLVIGGVVAAYRRLTRSRSGLRDACDVPKRTSRAGALASCGYDPVAGANQLKGHPVVFPFDSADGSYTEEMNTRLVAHLAVLAAVATLLAGCSSTATGDTSSPGVPLQLRLVISSVEGTCSAPALSSEGPASACDRAGTTTYELAKSLGVVTPTSVAFPENEGSTNSVILELNKVDTGTLGDVSRGAIDKHLAIVLDGRVLSAPLVKDSITTSKLTLAFGTASEAKQVAAELGASATP